MMAKLPNIPYGNATPTLRAPGVGGDIKAISAGVQAVRGAADTLGKLYENEARLNAASTFNEAQREYMRESADLTQDYHNNREKPASSFRTDLVGLRTRIFGKAMGGQSGIVQKYLQPKMDQYRTQIEAAEIEATTRLIASRSIMHLNDLTVQGLTDVDSGVNPEFIISDYVAEVSAQSIDAEVKQERIQTFTDNALGQRVTYLTREKDIASMMALQNSELFKRASPTVRAELTQQIDLAAQDITSREAELAGTNLALGEWSIERAMAHVGTFYSGYYGLDTKAHNEAMETTGYQFFNVMMDGMLAKGQYDEAMAILDSGAYNVAGKNIIPAKQVPGWIAAINRGRSETVSMSTAALFYEADDATAAALRGGGHAPDLKQRLADVAMDPNVTESGRQRAQIKLFELEATDDVTAIAANISIAPSTSLDLIKSTLNETIARTEQAGGQFFRAKMKAYETVRNSVDQHLKQRRDAPVDYAISNNHYIRGLWQEFESMWATVGMPESTTTLGDVQAAYRKYEGAVLAAQHSYGTLESQHETLPQDSTLAQNLVTRLTTGDRGERQAALGEAGVVLGLDGMHSLAKAELDTNPDVAHMLLFSTLPPQHGVRGITAITQGMQIMQGDAGSYPTLKDFRESLGTQNVAVPLAALGEYAGPVMSAMHTYAVGIASPEELANGEFSQKTLEAARNDIIGEAFVVNANGNFTLPFRDPATGAMRTAADIQSIFVRMQVDEAWAKETFGPLYTYGMDGSLNEASYKTVLAYATPILVGNGIYEISIPASTLIATPGMAVFRDEQGNIRSRQLDMTSVAADPAKYTSQYLLRVGEEGPTVP
jgi:hypothetical protein